PAPSLATATSAGANSAVYSAPTRSAPEEALLIAGYSAAVLLSTVGNLTVIVVVTRGRQCRTDLRGFLLSLAVADLLIGCFCLPFTLVNVLYRRWPLPDILCKLVSYCQLVAVTSSVLTNMAIGFDRFWVPAADLQSVRAVIVALWTASLLLSSVQLRVSGKYATGGGGPDDPHNGAAAASDNETASVVVVEMCREHWHSPGIQRAYSVFVLVLTYLLPVSVLCATYAAIGRKLWTRTLPGNADSARDQQHVRAKRKASFS
uniref:G_PROTEIN_RECEP_F1_2 domain-containing protein n=1 Tax=Macrostomum lignano TaxID=282301 RepID=A0A1I8HM50_9PLAT